MIKELKNRIKETENKIDELASSINSEKFAENLALNSLKSHLADLNFELYELNLARDKEILEFRLIGENAKGGNFPLEKVGDITKNLADSLFEISKFYRHGTKGGKKREAILRKTIDLRLESISNGSTIFNISGKTSPDLHGDSIIQHTFENTFNLLNSESPDELTENISNIGYKSIKPLSRLLETVTSLNLELEMNWFAPDNNKVTWEGHTDKLLTIHNTLTKHKVVDTEVIECYCEIITISKKGNFEILVDEEDSIIGKFSNDLYSQVKELHIGDFCIASIRKTVTQNVSTKVDKSDYFLLSITLDEH